MEGVNNNIDTLDFNCSADSRGVCTSRSIEVERTDERDDRDCYELTCGDCGATATVVVGSSLGNHGDILTVDGDLEHDS